MPQLIGALIALIIAIIVGKDAQSRGMNPWLWGIFNFLILIVALPIYLIVRKPKLEKQEGQEGQEAQQSQQAEQAEESKKVEGSSSE